LLYGVQHISDIAMDTDTCSCRSVFVFFFFFKQKTAYEITV